MSFFKVFHFFFVFLFLTAGFQPFPSEECRPDFFRTPFNKQEIQNIFSVKESYTRYKGQEGYLLFVERTPNINRMDYIFNLVSKALGPLFKELGWQQYKGSLEAFSKERGQVLDSSGRKS